MSKNMIPSEPITEGQIGKLNELLRARMLKEKIPQKDVFQDILEHQAEQLIDDLLAVTVKRIEANSSMVVRRVKVDRTRSPQAVLDATGRAQYTDQSVVAEMPKGEGEGEETEVFFFKVDRFVSDDDLDKEYELRGVKPADMYSQSAVNENDPAFADTYPNGTHWKDQNGKWCFATFSRWSDGLRLVDVSRSGNDWSDAWWFAGVRK